MPDLSTQVPEQAIVDMFAGVMAVSPQIYAAMLKDLATRHDVPCDDAFARYVSDVLAKQPPIDPEDF